MAKILYFTSAAATTHRGDNTAKLAGATSWWQPSAMSEARGAAATTATVASIAGTTVGIEFVSGAVALEWLSEPLSADFTISGTITGNLWGFESTMNDNTAINFVVDKIDGATGAITQIAKSARVTELATGNAVNNFTVTPTNTACKRGDRLRVRPFIDDAGAAMIVGTTTFSYNGPTAAAAGDSYVQFTENLTFEPTGDPGTIQITAGTLDLGAASTIGQLSGNDRVAGKFVAIGNILTGLQINLNKTGAPTDNLVIEIWDDSSGSPGSSIGTVATVAGTTLTTTTTLYTYSGLSIALTPASTYWVVISRSTANNASNYYRTYLIVELPANSQAWFSTGSWTVSFGSVFTVISNTVPVSTYYLTDTAETINPGSATEKKALTTRGGGSVNAVTNTAAGPTAGIQATASAGGAAVEWYTPPLNAVTLGGKAKLNIRAIESNAAANASLKAEIAVTAGDGTGAVVWGSACVESDNTLGGELGTTDAAKVAWVAGDDVAVTAGQRLRFRIYLDDPAVGPLVTGNSVTVSYAGTTASAAGDTYVLLPVLVTEQVSGKSQAVNDTLALADLLARVRASVRTPADTVGLTDSVKRQKVIPAVFTRSLDLRL